MAEDEAPARRPRQRRRAAPAPGASPSRTKPARNAHAAQTDVSAVRVTTRKPRKVAIPADSPVRLGEPLPPADGVVHETPRRRRSAALMPALIARADIPDDVAGRIELISPGPLEDGEFVLAGHPATPASDPDVTPQGDRPVAWWAVAGVGVAIVVIFVVGMGFTR